MGAGSTLNVGSGITLLSTDTTAPAIVVIEDASLEGGSTVNGTLDLSTATTLTLNNMQGTPITINGDLIFGAAGIELDGDVLASLSALPGGESMALFELTGTINAEGLLVTEEEGDEANKLFTNLTTGKYRVVYSKEGDEKGTLSIEAVAIPEPTTATLSLLALAALAARRRRK